MNIPPRLRIALHGLSRVGKDEVGKILMEAVPGMKRVAFGDLIKSDLDAMVRQHLGFSAFTEKDAEKNQIRQLLVHWGYANYTSIESRFFSTLPEIAVNTRIFRARECKLWKEAGGVVWAVERPGAKVAEPQELQELHASYPYISKTLWNNGTLEDLRTHVLHTLDWHLRHTNP